LGERGFFDGLLSRGVGVIGLQEMNERRRDVRGVEAFLEQQFDEGILAFELAVLERGAEFFQQQIDAGLLDLDEGGDAGALDFHAGEALDQPHLEQLAS
jgi:hypothetical protein